MIKSIQLENFFSFENAKIEFNKTENILVGINGSGKSNLLKAIQFLKEGVAGIGLTKLIIDTWGGFDAMCFCGENSQKESVSITFELDFNVLKGFGFSFEKDVFYKIVVGRKPGQDNYYISSEELYQKEGFYNKITKLREDFIFLKFENGRGIIYGISGHKSKPELKVLYDNLNPQELALFQINDPVRFLIQYAICEAIRKITVYNYFDTTPGSLIRKPMKSSGEKRLLHDGSNLPQMLNTIKINHRKHYLKMVEVLNEVNENFKGFEFNPIGGNIELMLEEAGLNRLLHVTHISDGTLRFLCLMSIIFNPERGGLVCIDEPEVGLHPDMIMNLASAIAEASETTQFIIATHSENFLNHFNLDRIRVFDKDEENRTVVNSFTEEDFKGWYDSYFPGKMWRAGDIGGNRW
ncbi:putative ATPase [Anaerobacterium chartisolvens]|uniref:Putative ATPase n=1 Tax=Anaerobacterium chartisolvens TaxID=1297424 RepID=A0A369AIB9_9FIRM|nr:AAA family ATPase [Anaerobacterium chartisolvens]RCX08911.1 putative ATPase [Anaerobacterium chartisolvens]